MHYAKDQLFCKKLSAVRPRDTNGSLPDCTIRCTQAHNSNCLSSCSTLTLTCMFSLTGMFLQGTGEGESLKYQP